MKPTILMKYISILLLSVLFFACAPGAEEGGGQDLASKQNSLTEKKNQLKTLQDDIKKLEDELAVLLPPKEEKKFPVNVLPLKKETFISYAKIQGTILTDNVVMASSETGGRIMNMSVNEGDYINAGQLIATMDAGIVQDQLNEIQTRLDLAKTMFERQERLWNQKIGSEMQFLQAKSNVESLEKSMATLRTQMGKKDVIAPMSDHTDTKYWFSKNSSRCS